MKKIQLPLKEIKSRYEEGLSAHQISKLYGVSQATIEKRLREINLPREFHQPLGCG